MSAVEGDSLRGIWTVYNDYEYSSNLPQTSETMDVVGLMPWYVNGEIIQIPLNRIVVQYWSGNEDYESNIIAYGEYNGNDVRIFYKGDNNSIYLSTAPDWSSSTGILKSRLPDVYNSLLTFTVESSTSGDFSLLEHYASFIELPLPPLPSLLENIFSTFSDVGSWIGTIISSLVALFWSFETASLTFLGILSVAGLAFSVIMLLFGIVTCFVGFSG